MLRTIHEADNSKTVKIFYTQCITVRLTSNVFHPTVFRCWMISCNWQLMMTLTKSMTRPIAGFLIKLITENATPNCRSWKILKEEHANCNGPYRCLTLLRAYHVPGKLFGNLTLPSKTAFAYIQQLQALSIIEDVAHVPNVCSSVFKSLCCRFLFLHRGMAKEVPKNVLPGVCKLR